MEAPEVETLREKSRSRERGSLLKSHLNLGKPVRAAVGNSIRRPEARKLSLTEASSTPPTAAAEFSRGVHRRAKIPISLCSFEMKAQSLGLRGPPKRPRMRAVLLACLSDENRLQNEAARSRCGLRITRLCRVAPARRGTNPRHACHAGSRARPRSGARAQPLLPGRLVSRSLCQSRPRPSLPRSSSA